MEAECCEYFQDIFTSSRPCQGQIDAALEGLLPKVTQDIKNLLDQPYTTEEISDALNQICLTKAPGLDGFPVIFFLKHWQEMGRGVMETCLHILNEQDTFPY